MQTSPRRGGRGSKKAKERKGPTERRHQIYSRESSLLLYPALRMERNVPDEEKARHEVKAKERRKEGNVMREGGKVRRKI